MGKDKISKYYRIGDNIQRALDAKGETQVWLAEQITKKAQQEGDEDKRYDRAHINKWCRNKNVPSTQNMEWVAEILDRSVEELVTGNFGNQVPEGISLDDPIISKEIQGILDAVESACEEGELNDDRTDRYKSLVEGKVKAIVKYITG